MARIQELQAELGADSGMVSASPSPVGAGGTGPSCLGYPIGNLLGL